MPMTPRGWKVWFQDGSILTSRTTPWRDLPGTGVEMVLVLYEETFDTLVSEWDEQGRRVNPRTVRERYRDVLTDQEAYWLELVDGVPVVRGGAVADIPAAVPVGMRKLGVIAAVRDARTAAWWEQYNARRREGEI